MLRDKLEFYQNNSDKLKIWHTVGKSFEDGRQIHFSFLNKLFLLYFNNYNVRLEI